MSKQFVYLSAPIAGHPEHRDTFARLAGIARALDMCPVNPLTVQPFEHDGPCPDTYRGAFGHDAACYMRTDLLALMDCDAILMADGWEDSRGCTTEYAVAKALGLTLLFEDGSRPDAWHVRAVPADVVDALPGMIARERSYRADDAYRTALQASRDAGMHRKPPRCTCGDPTDTDVEHYADGPCVRLVPAPGAGS